MRLQLFLLFTFITLICNSQQSKIEVDSGSKNVVGVIQSGADVSPKSDINLHQADSNSVQVSQNNQPAPKEKKSRSGFTEWVTNINNLFVLLISIATFIGFLWKGVPYLKKVMKKK